jgi:hypothetical protein
MTCLAYKHLSSIVYSLEGSSSEFKDEKLGSLSQDSRREVKSLYQCGYLFVSQVGIMVYCMQNLGIAFQFHFST